MTIGALVRETILLKRAYECDHEWVHHSETEDQCVRCTVIATPEGKKYLASRRSAGPRTDDRPTEKA